MNLSALSKETLISIIQDQQKQLDTDKSAITEPTQSPTDLLVTTDTSKNILYSYNLTDGDGFNKDRVLYDEGIAYVGVSENFTKRYGGFENYYNKVKEATHMITYKPRTHYGSKGGIFKDIYKLSNPRVLTSMDEYVKVTNLTPGVTISEQTWLGKTNWWWRPWMGDNGIGTYCIVWNAELVKELDIPFEDSGLATRTRFGYIKKGHALYEQL